MLSLGPCQHCGWKRGNCPRHLCSSCYSIKLVRLKYPTKTEVKFTADARDHDDINHPMPTPTSVMPGPGKVSVLAERWEAGEQLFHPLDAHGE